MIDKFKIFTSLIEIIDLLEEYSFQGETISGNLFIDEEKFKILKKLYDSSVLIELEGVRHFEYFNSNDIGKSYIISFDTDNIYQNLNVQFFNTIEEFSQNKAFKKDNFQKEFYVKEVNYFSIRDKENIPSELNKVFEIKNLIQFLKNSPVCDFVQEEGEPGYKFIIFQKQKLEFATNYSFAELKNFVNAKELVKELKDTKYNEARISIFKSTLIEWLLGIEADKRFLYFLNNFQEILNSFKDNFELFLTDFSFEKLKSEFEAHKLNYLKKIDDSITTIQNKVIPIPLAYLLVSTQLEKESPFGIQNWLILLAAFMFTGIVCLILYNQYSNLGELREEIKKLECNFKRKSNEVANKFDSDFRQLIKKTNDRRKIIVSIGITSILVTAIPLGLMVYYSCNLRC